MKAPVLAAVLAAAFATAALPAAAATISGAYSGTILNGTDSSDYFGGGNFAGDTATIAFSYDPGTLTHNVQSTLDDLVSTASTADITAAVTINGITHTYNSLGASGTSEIVAQKSGSGEEVTYAPAYTATDNVSFTLYTVGATGSGWVSGALLNADPFGSLRTYSLTNGGFVQNIYVQVNGGPYETFTFYQTTADQTVNGGLSAYTPETSDVPEPAALLLLAPALATLVAARRRQN